ncbi:36014_t:CDS:1, partial [Racocetra persica]
GKLFMILAVKNEIIELPHIFILRHSKLFVWYAKANLATLGVRCGKGGKSILRKGVENIATTIN